ncbi:hypothetical protein K6V21_26095 [Bacteroides cellulosilyticus]|uniref:transglutaminase domain-containing protein n=1 Tax=Bacteroides cellulosilyticus TaxID=246787 RepID=UPI001CCC6223|nr:transglutaminase domain-containing protein [Bacteroides cellulosilyticus]UBD69777.1 hypothetical protein K6V21_26095 [Bacteroides cellulosilyticus]
MKERLYSCLGVLLLCISTSIVYGRTISSTAMPALAPGKIPEEYTYSVDSLALYIDSHYDEEKSKVQAVYTWITSNLSYNVYTTFTSRNEVYSEAQELKNTLLTREGVCRQFALLFTRIVEKMGIPAFVINGYTRSKAGVVMPEPHDWCAAKIGAQWYLYDPTFGMGYIDNYQFVQAQSMKYCHVPAEESIQTHMPYDPIWQLLAYPYPYQEFDKGTFQQKPENPFCNFNDSIQKYLRQPRLNQLISACDRVLRNGQANRLTQYYLQLTQANIGVYRQREVYDIYNKTIKLQNQGCDLLSDFILYRKNGLKPRKSAKEMCGKVDKALQTAIAADSLLHTARNIPQQYASAVRNLQTSISELIEEINRQKVFIDEHSKGS